jgi:hypothetical protein
MWQMMWIAMLEAGHGYPCRHERLRIYRRQASYCTRYPNLKNKPDTYRPARKERRHARQRFAEIAVFCTSKLIDRTDRRQSKPALVVYAEIGSLLPALTNRQVTCASFRCSAVSQCSQDFNDKSSAVNVSHHP